MSYRRSHESGPDSSRWRCKHLGLLIRCGIPEVIANSDRRWRYVLLHGDDELGTGWNPAWIDREQAQALLDLLNPEIDGDAGYDLLERLRERVAGNGSGSGQG